MTEKIASYFLTLVFLVTAQNCFARPELEVALSDKNATAETKALYKNLRRISSKGYLFGHQDDLAYGVNWRYQLERSDVKEVTGDYPALYGWDLGGLEKNSAENLDGVPFEKMRQWIKDGYKRGGVVTLSCTLIIRLLVEVHGIQPMVPLHLYWKAGQITKNILTGLIK